MAKQSRTHLTRTEADEFDAITPLVKQMHKDFQELTKKKPDGGVGATRIVMVNRLLERAKKSLAKQPSWDLLDHLDADLVPQNADAMLVIGQYVAALEAVRTKFQGDEYGTLAWKIIG
jgi:hypothetical protein